MPLHGGKRIAKRHSQWIFGANKQSGRRKKIRPGRASMVLSLLAWYKRVALGHKAGKPKR